MLREIENFEYHKIPQIIYKSVKLSDHRVALSTLVNFAKQMLQDCDYILLDDMSGENQYTEYNFGGKTVLVLKNELSKMDEYAIRVNGIFEGSPVEVSVRKYDGIKALELSVKILDSKNELFEGIKELLNSYISDANYFYNRVDAIIKTYN